MIFLNVCDQESLRKDGSPPHPPPLEELLREDEELLEHPLTPRSPPPPLSCPPGWSGTGFQSRSRVLGWRLVTNTVVNSDMFVRNFGGRVVLSLLAGGPMMENVGRKQALMILAVPFILGWLVIGVTLIFGMILVRRLDKRGDLGRNDNESEAQLANYLQDAVTLPSGPVASVGNQSCILFKIFPIWKPNSIRRSLPSS